MVLYCVCGAAEDEALSSPHPCPIFCEALHPTAFLELQAGYGARGCLCEQHLSLLGSLHLSYSVSQLLAPAKLVQPSARQNLGMLGPPTCGNTLSRVQLTQNCCSSVDAMGISFLCPTELPLSSVYLCSHVSEQRMLSVPVFRRLSIFQWSFNGWLCVILGGL